MEATQAVQPENLGAYRIESLLGRGGMGEVYLAYDDRLHRHVAIKRLRSDGKVGEKQLERFRREARAVARLSHPAIVQVHDVLETDEGDCIVMEYVEGLRLSELIARHDLDLSRIVALGREIADGLGEAHSKGLVHRDLKSENVIVTPAGRPKILDFGLVLPLWHEGEEDSLTASGVLIGTVRAMSPEQAEGGDLDHRADLFSLGVLLYEMLTGISPFRGANAIDTLRRVMMEEPKSVLELVPETPPALSDLVARLLDKDSRKRPQNAHLVAAELGELSIELATGEGKPKRLSPGSTPIDQNTAVRTLDGREDRVLDDAPTQDPVLRSGVSVLGDEDSSSRPVIRTLVLVDLVDSTEMVERLGDEKAIEITRRHDRLARDLLARYDGLEIDKTDGFLLLFERPADAVTFALDYQQSVIKLAQEVDAELQARTGIHLGEVFLHRNRPEDVARGAKPLEVEGLAKPLAARIMALAAARQILLSGFAFDLARRGVGGKLSDKNLDWLAHGPYLCKGIDEPVEIFEVGVRGFSPLAAPPDTEKARRAVAISDEHTLGWRPAVGQTIPHRSHWHLEERLGEGGFGEVWLAGHEATGEKRVFKFCFEANRLRALQREVTLFRLLKEALGHRDDIARVLDWNFDAAPYFLESEYTEGGNLVAWCEQQGGLVEVPIATRLELLAQVADALAAAHSVGVLHKDVKPENVLIRTESMSAPRAQLTDFGIGRVTDRAALLARGITVVGLTETLSAKSDVSTGGTLRFMAPELLEGKPATIQADIYSLGVMLYQVVVGDFARALAPGWRREVDDEVLREDIALLVDGAPGRRPAGAREVAERLRTVDVRRGRLEAERRQAREAEASRRANERSRRRRRLLATAVAIFLVVVSMLAIQATRAHREAQRLRGQAEGLVSFMLGDLREKLEPVGRLDVLDSVADQALDYFASVDPSDMTETTRARHTEALRQIGKVRSSQGNQEGALQVFRQALEQSQSLVDHDPDNPRWQFLLGNTHVVIGNVRILQGRLDEALAEFEAYLEISRRLLEGDPDNPEYLLEVADAHSNLGSAMDRLGHADDALEHQELNLQIKQRLTELDPGRTDWQHKLASSHVRLGRALRAQGDLARALEHFEANLEIMERLLAEDRSNTQWQRRLAIGHSSAASIRAALGELEPARWHRRRYLELAQAMADLDPDNKNWQSLLAVAHASYGKATGALGDLEAGLRHTGLAVDLTGRLVAGDPSNKLELRYLANAHKERGFLRLAGGDPEGALREARKARELLEPLMAEKDPAGTVRLYASRSFLLIGRALAAMNDVKGSQAAFEEAIEAIRPLVAGSRDYPFLAAWALAHLELGRSDEVRSTVAALLTLGYQDRDFLTTCTARGLKCE